MARKKVSQWPQAPRRYHPARQKGTRFESMADARKRDLARSKILATQPDIAAANTKLVRSLAKPNRHHRSMASARYVRTCRVQFNGQVHYLIDRRSAAVKFGTLIPAGWLTPADQLVNVVPKVLLERMRGVANRAGAGRATGWVTIVLDLEYVDHLDSWSLHLHSLSTGGKSRVLHSLRGKPKFRRCADHLDIGKRPVQMKPIRAGTESQTTNYLVKTFFGMQVYIERDGRMVRTKGRRALPPRREAELLAWLSRWTLDDFVLTLGSYFGKSRLCVSKRRRS